MTRCAIAVAAGMAALRLLIKQLAIRLSTINPCKSLVIPQTAGFASNVSEGQP